jgi:hypothetical protein
MELVYGVIGRSGGKYVSLEPFSARVEKTRSDVCARFCYGMTVLGKPVELDGVYKRDAKPQDRELYVAWLKIAEELIHQGKLVSHPVVVGGSGFNAILRGVDTVRKGKISGHKLVYTM